MNVDRTSASAATAAATFVLCFGHHWQHKTQRKRCDQNRTLLHRTLLPPPTPSERITIQEPFCCNRGGSWVGRIAHKKTGGAEAPPAKLENPLSIAGGLNPQ